VSIRGANVTAAAARPRSSRVLRRRPGIRGVVASSPSSVCSRSAAASSRSRRRRRPRSPAPRPGPRRPRILTPPPAV